MSTKNKILVYIESFALIAQNELLQIVVRIKGIHSQVGKIF